MQASRLLPTRQRVPPVMSTWRVSWIRCGSVPSRPTGSISGREWSASDARGCSKTRRSVRRSVRGTASASFSATGRDGSGSHGRIWFSTVPGSPATRTRSATAGSRLPARAGSGGGSGAGSRISGPSPRRGWGAPCSLREAATRRRRWRGTLRRSQPAGRTHGSSGSSGATPPTWGAVPGDPLRGRRRLTEMAETLLRGASPSVEVLPGLVVDALEEENGRLRVRLRGPGGNTP